MAMNGGSTQSTRIHQFPVGKNQPPTLGPTMRFTTSEYAANPTTAVKYPGMRLASSLPK